MVQGWSFYASTLQDVNSLNVSGLTPLTSYSITAVAKGNGSSTSNSQASNALSAQTKNVAPTLVSIATNSTGSKIIAVFSREMAASPTLVGVSTNPEKTITGVDLGTDTTTIEISVGSNFGMGEGITATLPSWEPADGGDAYAGIANVSVINNVTAISLKGASSSDYINAGYTFPTLTDTDTVEFILRGSLLNPTVTSTLYITGSRNTTSPLKDLFDFYVASTGAVTISANLSIAKASTFTPGTVITEIKQDINLTESGYINRWWNGNKLTHLTLTGLNTASGARPWYLFAQNNNGSVYLPAYNAQISEFIIKINGTEVVHMVAQAAGYFHDTVRNSDHYNRNAGSNLYPLTVA